MVVRKTLFEELEDLSALYEITNQCHHAVKVEEVKKRVLEISPRCNVRCVPLEMSEKLEVANSVLSVLKVMHERGWVHRDVAWRNIWYDPIGKKWMLGDFECSAKKNEEVWPNKLTVNSLEVQDGSKVKSEDEHRPEDDITQLKYALELFHDVTINADYVASVTEGL
jgi:serine/threonine protein kinase